MKESGAYDEEPPCGKKLGRLPINEKLETPPAESALRTAPVCKEPPAAQAEGPRDQDKTRTGEPGFGEL